MKQDFFFAAKCRGCGKQLYGILDNPALHQQMSQTAIERVHEKFAIQVVADQYIHLLKKIVNESMRIAVR